MLYHILVQSLNNGRVDPDWCQPISLFAGWNRSDDAWLIVYIVFHTAEFVANALEITVWCTPKNVPDLKTVVLRSIFNKTTYISTSKNVFVWYFPYSIIKKNIRKSIEMKNEYPKSNFWINFVLLNLIFKYNHHKVNVFGNNIAMYVRLH